VIPVKARLSGSFEVSADRSDQNSVTCGYLRVVAEDAGELDTNGVLFWSVSIPAWFVD
jgi:hypothetical protein